MRRSHAEADKRPRSPSRTTAENVCYVKLLVERGAGTNAAKLTRSPTALMVMARYSGLVRFTRLVDGVIAPILAAAGIILLFFSGDTVALAAIEILSAGPSYAKQTTGPRAQSHQT